ncbi:MAG: prepilin-type N-terminal cleavage/methylation domain-containing protein [Desulfobulbales bacterium]|nr:prepilin-type N-terminal cleavage/methylation domain-containing protein [Desulfobulbales bacterium]
MADSSSDKIDPGGRRRRQNQGMTVIELMISICIIGVVASFAVPAYIYSVQQGRIVALVLPRLHIIESRISLFYTLYDRLPSGEDVKEVLEDIDTENLDISLVSGVVVMKIVADDPASKLDIVDGKILIASPVIGKNGVVSWHLAGELADRLRISY